MFMALNFAWILFWGICYVLIARRGFKDKTYGLPLVAICTDLSWVFIFTFVFFQTPFMLLFVVVDLIFLYQLIRYRESDWTGLSRAQYFGAIALAIGTSFLLILGFTIQFQDFHGVYTSLIDILLASVLFLFLLHRRGSVRGQSLYIAITKALGNLTAVLAFSFFAFPGLPARAGIQLFHGALTLPLFDTRYPVGNYQHDVFVHALGVVIVIYDLLYIAQYVRVARREGVDIWRRL